MKKWHLFGAAIVIIAAVAVFGDNGLIDLKRFKKERDGIISYNSALEKENVELEKKIALLKTDERYIEYVAKRELGMIGKDEVIYKFRRIEKPAGKNR